MHRPKLGWVRKFLGGSLQYELWYYGKCNLKKKGILIDILDAKIVKTSTKNHDHPTKSKNEGNQLNTWNNFYDLDITYWTHEPQY